jgi:hypothetical protein
MLSLEGLVSVEIFSRIKLLVTEDLRNVSGTNDGVLPRFHVSRSLPVQ